MCKQLEGKVPKTTRAISCLKGLDVTKSKCVTLSQYIEDTLHISCGALSGANLAPEIALEKYSETTIAYNPVDSSDFLTSSLLLSLFHRPYFHVNVISDVTGVCLAGALKNVVAIAAGFVEGLGWGDNAKAAIMRRGLLEMIQFGTMFFDSCDPQTFLQESAGVADLITSCAGGRNVRMGREFAKAQGKKDLKTLEIELLNGQSAQGIVTAREVFEFLEEKELTEKFPLMVATYNIAFNGLAVSISIFHSDFYA